MHDRVLNVPQDSLSDYESSAQYYSCIAVVLIGTVGRYEEHVIEECMYDVRLCLGRILREGGVSRARPIDHHQSRLMPEEYRTVHALPILALDANLCSKPGTCILVRKI